MFLRFPTHAPQHKTATIPGGLGDWSSTTFPLCGKGGGAVGGGPPSCSGMQQRRRSLAPSGSHLGRHLRRETERARGSLRGAWKGEEEVRRMRLRGIRNSPPLASDGVLPIPALPRERPVTSSHVPPGLRLKTLGRHSWYRHPTADEPL